GPARRAARARVRGARRTVRSGPLPPFRRGLRDGRRGRPPRADRRSLANHPPGRCRVDAGLRYLGPPPEPPRGHVPPHSPRTPLPASNLSGSVFPDTTPQLCSGRPCPAARPCSARRTKELPMPEAVIVATARTPIGRAFKGSLKDVRPDDLAVTAVRAALDKVPQL